MLDVCTFRLVSNLRITYVIEIRERPINGGNLTLFQFRNIKYNIRNFEVLSADLRRTVNYGIETITYGAPSLWIKLLSEYKLTASLEEFKMKIKNGNVTYVPAGHANNFKKILDMLIRNSVKQYVKYVNLVCFCTHFLRKIRNLIPYKIMK